MASELLLIRTLLLPLLKQYKDTFLNSIRTHSKMHTDVFLPLSRYYEHISTVSSQGVEWRHFVIAYQAIIITYPTVQVWFPDHQLSFITCTTVWNRFPDHYYLFNGHCCLFQKNSPWMVFSIIVIARVTVPGYSLFRNGSRISFILFIINNRS